MVLEVGSFALTLFILAIQFQIDQYTYATSEIRLSSTHSANIMHCYRLSQYRKSQASFYGSCWVISAAPEAVPDPGPVTKVSGVINMHPFHE